MAGTALLAGCSSKDDELEQFIAETKKQPGGRVEPLPEVKPYETYAYESTRTCVRRSCRAAPVAGDRRRRATRHQAQSRVPRAVLARHAEAWSARCSSKAGSSAWCRPRTASCTGFCPAITSVRTTARSLRYPPPKITFVEIVPDGMGGYMERPAALGLND